MPVGPVAPVVPLAPVVPVGPFGSDFLMSEVVRVQYALAALLICRQLLTTTFPFVTVRLKRTTLDPTCAK